MRYFKLALLSSILLMGCAETPDTTMTRHQIDDLADNDRDGVINQRDLCADTPEGVTVDIKGCANWKIVEDVEVLSVAFDFDKYDLKPDHTAVLNELVRLLESSLMLRLPWSEIPVLKVQTCITKHWPRKERA